MVRYLFIRLKERKCDMLSVRRGVLRTHHKTYLIPFANCFNGNKVCDKQWYNRYLWRLLSFITQKLTENIIFPLSKYNISAINVFMIDNKHQNFRNVDLNHITLRKKFKYNWTYIRNDEED